MRKSDICATNLEVLESRLFLSTSPVLGFGEGAVPVELSPVDTIALPGEISQSGDSSLYSFIAPANGRVTIDMAAGTDLLDPFLEVFNANGRKLRRNNNLSRGTRDSRIKLRVKAGQTYYIKARGVGESAGQYDLTLTSRPNDEAGNNPIGAKGWRISRRGAGWRTASINYGQDTDYFRVKAPKTGKLTVTMSPLGLAATLQCRLMLIDIEGAAAAVGEETDENPGSSVEFEVVGGQTYYLRAAGRSSGTGRYRIDVKTKANRPPSGTNDTLIAQRGVPTVTDDVLANDTDPDGDTLTVDSFTQGSHGVVSYNDDGTFTYTSDAGYTGPDSFTYRVADGRGKYATVKVAVTVSDANETPVAVDDLVVTEEDTPVATGDVLANDTDGNGDVLTITGFTQPSHGVVAYDGDGGFIYTPDGGYTGADSFTYTVSDGRGGTAAATVRLTVTAVNDTPDAANDGAVTNEDTAVVTGNVLANDSDLDGDTLTITGFTQPGHGVVSYNGNGTFSYTPDADYNGADAFTYTVSDGNGGTDTATVAIAIAAANDDPVAQNDVAVTAEDSSAAITNALSNDVDADGDTLAVTGFSQPDHGIVSYDGGGTFTYTPDADYHGADSFVYTVADGSGGTDTAVVQITVTASNDDPQAGDDAVITTEDTAVVTGNVLADDTDVDGDALYVDGFTQPAHGTVTYNGNGRFTYTPDADYNGADGFTYTVADDNGGTDTATVAIAVTAANDDPVAQDDAVVTDEDVSVITANVLANDTDVDGDTLTVASFTQAAHGEVLYNGNGRFTYLPDLHYFGADSFSYTVTDGAGRTSTATVDVTVAAVNNDPDVVDDGMVTTEDVTTVTHNVLANDTDVDGEALRVDSFTQPANGAVVYNGDGTFTYTPDADYHGSDSFTYTVTDDHDGFATATVQIIVSAVNDQPQPQDDAAVTAEDTAIVTGNVLANDVDADGDTLTIYDYTQGGHGAVAYNGDGTFSYTPDADYQGADSFTYTVTDGHGGSQTATVYITVTAANDLPDAQTDLFVTTEDTPVVTGNVLANDSDGDGDALIVDGFTQPDHGVVSYNGDGTFSYTPDADFFGLDTFTYTVADGKGGEAIGEVRIGVSGINDAPVAGDDAAVTTEDTAVVTGDVLANDVDPDSQTLSIDSFTQPDHGTVSYNGDGTFTYTPDADYSGADSFVYTVTDGGAGFAVATVSLTISVVNDSPDALADTVVTTEDTAVVTGDVLANDVDPDGDTLSVASFTQAAHGTVVYNGGGRFTYTPAANYNGGDTFSYTVSDGHGGTDTATVAITVAAANDAPDATGDTLVTTEETAVTTGNVLANDSDVDGDTIRVAGFTQAAHGTVVDNGNGTFTYTPEANYSGADAFTYTVTDDNGGTDTAAVNITVAATTNNRPDAKHDALVVTEDITATADTILDNDIDPDGDPLSIVSFTQGAHGTVADNGDGTLSYTPDAEYNGSDSFTYTISDGHGGTDTATVSIVVAAANDAPEATDDVLVTTEDTAATVDVLANDTDLDGNWLSIASFTQAGHGTVVKSGDGTFSYTPDAEYSGADSFTYTVTDSRGGTDTATVSIIVNAANDDPVTTDDAVVTDEDTAVTTDNVLANDSDADGDTLSIASFTQAAHGTVVDNGNGTFGYTPDAGYNGADSFTYTVTDGNGGADTATVNIVINAVNYSPTAADDTLVTNEDTAVTAANVLANDTDPDGDTLSIASFTQAAHGTVIDNGDGTFDYTPNTNYHGADSFSYTVTDGNGGTATATVTVTVADVNDSPTTASDVAVTTEDTAVVITGVLDNDTDPDGDGLTIAGFTQADHGTVTLNGGSFTYTPDAGYAGADQFTYTVSDGRGGTAMGTVLVSVQADDPNPIVVNVVDDGGVLQMLIEGTSLADTITLSQSADSITLMTDLTTDVYQGVFDSIVVYGFAGNDVIRTTRSVTADTWIYAGDGADSLFANGTGTAELDGGGGDDLLVSIDGFTDTLIGGGGLDSFWNDAVDVIADVSADEVAAAAVHSVEEFYQPWTTDSGSDDYIPLSIDGQNFRDPATNSKADGYQNYADAPLFNDTPDANDVRQGQIGDCYFLASLAAYADVDPEAIRQSIAPLGDGTYAVRYYSWDGTESVLRIDADLPVKNGSIAYAKLSHDGETWVPLLEKAFTHFRYGTDSYQSIDLGWPDAVFQMLTDCRTDSQWTSNLNGDDLADYVADHLNAGHAVTVVSQTSSVYPIIGNHVYAVVDVEFEGGETYYTVYNPWGHDGTGSFDDNSSDGMLRLTAAQMEASFRMVTAALS